MPQYPPPPDVHLAVTRCSPCTPYQCPRTANLRSDRCSRSRPRPARDHAAAAVRGDDQAGVHPLAAPRGLGPSRRCPAASARTHARAFTPSRTSTPAPARAVQQRAVQARRGARRSPGRRPAAGRRRGSGAVGARRAPCPRSGCGRRARTAASRVQRVQQAPGLGRHALAADLVPREARLVDEHDVVPALAQEDRAGRARRPPPTTTTSRARVTLRPPSPRPPAAGRASGDVDAHGECRPAANASRSSARGEGAADGEQPVLDADPRAEEQREGGPAERRRAPAPGAGRSRPAPAAPAAIQLAQHARDVRAVEVMQEERRRHHVEARVREGQRVHVGRRRAASSAGAACRCSGLMSTPTTATRPPSCDAIHDGHVAGAAADVEQRGCVRRAEEGPDGPASSARGCRASG